MSIFTRHIIKLFPVTDPNRNSADMLAFITLKANMMKKWILGTFRHK